MRKSILDTPAFAEMLADRCRAHVKSGDKTALAKRVELDVAVDSLNACFRLLEADLLDRCDRLAAENAKLAEALHLLVPRLESQEARRGN